MGFKGSGVRPISNWSCNDSTWPWWPLPELMRRGGYGKCSSLIYSTRSSALRQAAWIAEPRGEAFRLQGFASLFRNERQHSTFSSILMALIKSGGFNVVSRCTYSLPGMFKGEIGTHLRTWGQFLRKFFLTVLYSWRREGFMFFSWVLL